MNASRWAAVRAVFDELVELEPTVRAGRLDQLGLTDPQLREDVSALLSADAHADERLGSLDLPVLSPLVSPDHEQRDRLQAALAQRYLIERELGRGGMATVYLARDLKHERLVALKVLQPSLAASLGPERFLREIRTAARLQHPHILAVHDSGTVDTGAAAGAELLWYTMPYVEGESLRQRLAREPRLPLATAVQIALEVADALGHAHRHGVIHRDIKPENILLSSDRPADGRGQHCVVADFGVARVVEAAGGGTLTEAGLAIGTPAYMSPEQAVGDAQLDGRSDLYALGCVLYEMLAGEAPFSARTPQAMIARRLSEPVPSLRALRDVPEWVERVVTRALARSPEDRFADVEQFAGALAAAGDGGAASPLEPVPRTSLLLRGIVLAGGAVLAVALGFAMYHRPGPAAVDANLVAVAPFEVLDPSLQIWREGLVDILSRDLDGAGPLRTVSQTVVLKHWQGRADRPSAAALGKHTGAGVVVFGTVVRKGTDSVSLRATLLDFARQATEPELEVVGEERRMGDLADSLGLRILRALGGNRPLGSVRRVSLGSRSLPALKEFLRGEQFYRRGLWDSALVHYDRAVTQDSTFALALRRMFFALSWAPQTSATYRTLGEYDRRAVLFNRGLSPRDSLLLAADSLAIAASETGDPARVIEFSFHRARVLENAARRYPDDPEIWTELGEQRYHDPAPLGRVPAPALQAFDRAIALDSGFAPAYEHTVELAMQLNRPDLARHYVRAYRGLAARDANAPAMRLVGLVFDSGGVRAPAVARAVQSATAVGLWRAGVEHFKWWADSDETAVAMLRELATGGHDVAGARPMPADSLMWRQSLASALTFRGHLHAAAEANHQLIADGNASPFSASQDPFLDLALLGVIDDSISRRTFAQSFLPGALWDGNPLPRYLRGLPWWLARGDTGAITRFERRAAELQRRADSPEATLRARYLGAAAGAYLALARGDSAEGLRRLQAIPDTLCLVGNCFHEKLLLARLLAAHGEDRPAAEVLDRWVWSDESVPSLTSSASFVLAALERGRIAERLGDRAKARERYGFVVNVWRRADPELESKVAEAQAGLRRTSAEGISPP